MSEPWRDRSGKRFGQMLDGGHPHAGRLAAKNLNGERALVLVEAHLPFRFRIVARQTFD